MYVISNVILGHRSKIAHMLAERELSNAWESDIGQDKAASLISRVALNAVLLKPERYSITEKFCP